MIPRHDGLVPSIRGPISSSTAAAASPTRKVAITVKCYTIRPTALPQNSAVKNNSGGTLTGSTSDEHERRLYTFLPSVDAPAPPKELHTAPYFFGDTDAGSAATKIANTEEEYSDENNGDDLAGIEGQQQLNQQGRFASINAADSTSTANMTSKGRRQRRGREPMRLEYKGIMDASLANPYADRVVKMASSPAAAYRHLSCVLLELPTAWRDGEKHRDRTNEAASSANNLILPTVLERPVLQLWGERKEASAVAVAVSGTDTLRSATGISTSWYSEQSTRINKKDWKTMDAADAEMHRPTNWSDDDGGADEDENSETALAARERKRAKAEATSQSVSSFWAGTKEVLRQQTGTVEAEEREGKNVVVPKTKQAAQQSSAVVATTAIRPAVAEKEVDPKKETLKEPLPSIAKLTVKEGITARTLPLPPPIPTTTAAITTSGAPPPLVHAKGPTTTALETPDNSIKLPVLAARVLREMRQTEGRTGASLMELQKRIFKQLPEFSDMNRKVNSAETRKEAVEWFQACQRDLRVWLQGHGYMIGSDKTVTFGE